ncbi:hypothetical protein D3C72_1450550 [compost metagenome]
MSSAAYILAPASVETSRPVTTLANCSRVMVVDRPSRVSSAFKADWIGAMRWASVRNSSAKKVEDFTNSSSPPDSCTRRSRASMEPTPTAPKLMPNEAMT